MKIALEYQDNVSTKSKRLQKILDSQNENLKRISKEFTCFMDVILYKDIANEACL